MDLLDSLKLREVKDAKDAIFEQSSNLCALTNLFFGGTEVYGMIVQGKYKVLLLG